MMSADELSALADCMAILLEDIRRNRMNAPRDDTGCDDDTQPGTAGDGQ